MFAETIKKDIMIWDGSYIQIRMHSGRTDGSYGHNDKENRSGLGSYHYHHKLPAHLHPNGSCSYEKVKAGSIINPYTGKKINLGKPYLYEDNYFFPLNLVAGALTVNDKLGVESDNSDRGTFYACVTGDSALDKLGERFTFSYTQDSIGLPDNEFFTSDDGILRLLATSDSNSTSVFISMETVREYMTGEGYFTDLLKDDSDCWCFTVRKPIIHSMYINSLGNGNTYNVGDELTVMANIEHVARAWLTVGGNTDGFSESIQNLENKTKVTFNTFKLTEYDIGSAAINRGSLTIRVNGHTGGTCFSR